MNHTLQNLMQEATRLTQAGRLSEATAIIQRALGAGTGQNGMPSTSGGTSADPWVIDDCVVEVVQRKPVAMRAGAPDSPRATTRSGESFAEGVFAAGGRSLDYKLYLPPTVSGRKALPLVVMLHGCTQDPDDFATGTGMNELGREEGFCVLYPAQSQSANPQRCWNWFKHNHQQRGHGEPALIAGMTRQVMRDHAIDARRVYIAGLSAGGAMASIVAEAYPDLFAAVGVHSGLPSGSASNVGEALSAMKSGASEARGTLASSMTRKGSNGAVPVIVFHGDADPTVHQRNGEQVIAAALASDVEACSRASAGDVRVETGLAAGKRRYTRSVHTSRAGAPMAEHWLIHGAGHAWSGGRPAGSYTDAKGPDASREMLRFFFEHPHANPRTESA